LNREEARFVLDCSIVMAWCFVDEWSSVADHALAALASSHAAVPSLWVLEVANSLVIGERRGRSTAANTVRWTEYLSALPIVAEARPTSRLWQTVVPVAREHGLSAYDAAYLELALRRGLPLATLDAGLEKAARKAGVPLFREGRT